MEFSPNPFTSYPIPVVTPFDGTANSVAYIQSIGAGTFNVKFFARTGAASTPVDTQFTFIVVDLGSN